MSVESRLDKDAATAAEAPCKALARVISTRVKDLGGFTVRRALPYHAQKSVGPWVFFDHFGPVDFAPGEGMDVRPHPHINLATVTYLFEGAIVHRDSLGSHEEIKPGAINLMVAGRGIVHSERTGDALRKSGHRLHGLQLWHALPQAHEETEPLFLHYGADRIPACAPATGVSGRVMMGSAFGAVSPVKTFAETLYMEAVLEPGASFAAPPSPELAAYVVEGAVQIGGERVVAGDMAVLARPEAVIEAGDGGSARIALIGGEPLGRRTIWWNFVSSRPERIEQAKADWAQGRFAAVPGETEFIPLPAD